MHLKPKKTTQFYIMQKLSCIKYVIYVCACMGKQYGIIVIILSGCFTLLLFSMRSRLGIYNFGSDSAKNKVKISPHSPYCGLQNDI